MAFRVNNVNENITRKGTDIDVDSVMRINYVCQWMEHVREWEERYGDGGRTDFWLDWK